MFHTKLMDLQEKTTLKLDFAPLKLMSFEKVV